MQPLDVVARKEKNTQNDFIIMSTHSGFYYVTSQVLTVNQQNEEQPPSKVLDTMVKYVRHFFGCEDCSRHFLQGSEDGKVIKHEVVNKTSSILWLWNFHNKVNRRLSGDLTDDKRFPKEVFPNRQHCSDCYNDRLGQNLWSEFNLEKVIHFLDEIYGANQLDFHGLTENPLHIVT